MFKRNKNTTTINAVKKIIPTNQYAISEKGINKHALQVIEKLDKAGFEAYLVGGGVRDLLLDRHPKDFDIVTNASPNAIKKVFRNCRLIGRRFRLAHIFFGNDIIEVATYRAGHEGAKEKHAQVNDEGMVLRDNVYGNIEQDAARRDFTVNALFYFPKKNELIDFFDGFKDLKNKKLKIIGDAETRYREDPVRMIRAARIGGKLGLKLTKETEAPIAKLKNLLYTIPTSRLHDEVIKLFHTGYSDNIFPMLLRLGLFEALFPLTNQYLETDHKKTIKIVETLFSNTDKRIRAQKPVTPIFLFATLLWIPFQKQFQKLVEEKTPRMQAFDRVYENILFKQREITAIPKHTSYAIYDIWHLQHRLEERRKRFINSILHHKKFRAAYDLLILRAAIDKKLNEIVEWWTELQEVDIQERKQMVLMLPEEKQFRRHTKKRRSKR